MYCPSCGTHNDDNNFRCVQCGQIIQHVAAPMQAPATHEHVPNYLAQSILVTVLCCWPLGIPAIMAASSVNSRLAAGDVDGAWDASRRARKWTTLSFALGLVAIGLQVIVLFVAPALSPFGRF